VKSESEIGKPVMAQRGKISADVPALWRRYAL